MVTMANSFPSEVKVSVLPAGPQPSEIPSTPSIVACSVMGLLRRAYWGEGATMAEDSGGGWGGGGGGGERERIRTS